MCDSFAKFYVCSWKKVAFEKKELFEGRFSNGFFSNRFKKSERVARFVAKIRTNNSKYPKILVQNFLPKAPIQMPQFFPMMVINHFISLTDPTKTGPIVDAAMKIHQRVIFSRINLFKNKI